MISVDFWDEISCEWDHVELDIPANSDPHTIIQAVDAAVAEPVGSIPPEEAWHLKSYSQTGPLLTIECRTSRNHLGIILVNLEEGRADRSCSEPMNRLKSQAGGRK